MPNKFDVSSADLPQCQCDILPPESHTRRRFRPSIGGISEILQPMWRREIPIILQLRLLLLTELVTKTHYSRPCGRSY
jgi:hypothetical protein